MRTGAAEGFTARPSAGGTRPVVPATWRRDTAAPVAPVVQRVAADPVAPPRPHAPLPARTAPPAGQEPPLPEAAQAPRPAAVRPTAPQGNAQGNAQAVQRAVAEAGLTGVPVTVVQRKPDRGPAPERPTPERETDLDVEDLARRLIDPVARLLRADLRRGRERSGRPYDGRR
ncbi:hypothetical protein AMK30_05560 [Streptomyces sp. CB02460]|nr:hypothetical protein AMK30_05560 [Streptomyces sp. CB02460]